MWQSTLYLTLVHYYVALNTFTKQEVTLSDALWWCPLHDQLSCGECFVNQMGVDCMRTSRSDDKISYTKPK